MTAKLDYGEMGQRVRALRVPRKLTQEQLGESIGVSTSFIGHIERGEKQCSLETVARLAVFLNMNIDYLVFGRRNLCDQQVCSLYMDLEKLLKAYSEGQSAH